MTTSVTEAADKAIEDGKAELARLDGSSPMDALSEEELARAGARAPFVAEDAERLLPAELVRRVRAALVAGDRPLMFLWLRSASARLERERGRNGSSTDLQELSGLVRELQERFHDPKAAERRHKAERRIESGKTLRGRPRLARVQLDGTMERARQEMAARYRL